MKLKSGWELTQNHHEQNTRVQQKILVTWNGELELILYIYQQHLDGLKVNWNANVD